MNVLNSVKKSGVQSSPLIRQNKAKSILIYLLRLIILPSIGFVIIYPLIYMIITSLRSKASFMNSARVWIPEDFAVKSNYSLAIDILEYGRAALATFKYQIISALLEVATCAIAAYGFARFKFRSKKILTIFLFSTILIPDIMIIIPRVVNFSRLDFLGIFGLIAKITGADLRLNILDSGFAFWLPSLFASGLKSGIIIFIYMQFFKGLPYELEEAAWVDGANPVRTFISIVIPSSGVVILTTCVFSLIWHYNDYLLASMYINNDYPLAVMLNLMTSRLATWGYLISPQNPETMAFLMAACVLFVVPMLIVYMILQRWFIESIDRVGITG